jgi:3-oxoacyl-[acyl-carrier-protein] synthase II
MSRRRVVVTGVGIRSPLGNTPAANLAALREGRSGIVRMPAWDRISDLRTRVAGVADAGDPARYPRETRRTMGRVGLLAAGALDDAVADSGLPREVASGERSWLLVGSTLGALADLEGMFVRLDRTQSVLGAQAAGALRSMAHTAAITCALHLRFRGRLLAPSAACATGSTSVGMGYEAIRGGHADVAIAGGADELHVSTAVIFDILQAASSGFNDFPSRTPRPFDARRDGIVCSEGAGFLVLESLDGARARGARIHGEVKGYSSNSSGTHATTPDADAIARCMKEALADAGISRDAIPYVNAHATGTATGDAAEAKAIGDVFGPGVAVSSTKGHLGHTMAAAGALETILSLLMLREGFLHPTLNLEEVAPDCRGVEHLREVREARPSAIAKNNFALGGINTCLVLGSA